MKPRQQRYLPLLLTFIVGLLILFSPQETAAQTSDCSSRISHIRIPTYIYDDEGNKWTETGHVCADPVYNGVSITRYSGIKNVYFTCSERGGNVINTFISRTYRCRGGTVDIAINPPPNYECVDWNYLGISNGYGNPVNNNYGTGTGCRITVPYPAGDWDRQIIANIRPLRTQIWGLKLKMPNMYSHPSTDGQTVTLANGANTLATTTANPYFFSDIDSRPTYTVSVTQPAVNYSVGYSYCFNQVAPDCSHIPITLGNSITFNSPPGGFTDLWWLYWEYIGWYRLKEASFTKQGSLVNFIPPNVIPYDGFDTDQEYLTISQNDPNGVGVVTAGFGIDLGPNTSNVSQKNWAKINYNANKGYLSNLSSFLAYARARKEIKVITNINDIESNKINIFQGNLTLQNNTINPSRDNMVLIVQGNLTIQSAPGGNFNQARRSWGFIVTGNINVNPSINEMNGVFIANNYDLAYGAASSTTALKVVGNLISNTPLSNIKRYRPVADYQRASLYIVFFPEYYYDLVPYLSTITQEGRQLE